MKFSLQVIIENLVYCYRFTHFTVVFSAPKLRRTPFAQCVKLSLIYAQIVQVCKNQPFRRVWTIVYGIMDDIPYPWAII
jgi:hypothetical protein